MEHTDMQAYVEKVKENWGMYGCTIMSDGWTGPMRLSIINFMVYSNGKTIFLKSVDASNKTKDAKYIAKLLKDVIKEFGPSNVVHIVTNNGSAFVKAREIMMERYPIYWTPCAAHCIDLIFEDIGKQESVANVINKARKLTNYIYNHGWLLAQMRIFCQGDLFRPGATQFEINYITINSILNKKAGLRQLFTSEEWYNSRFNESEEGKRIESRVLDHRFWDAMKGVQSIYEPLYSILRIVDTEVVPTMPILYDMFHIMKEKISKLKGKKWILKIINHRWDVTLSRPLHQTGVGHNKELLSGLQRVFERLNPTADRGLQAFGAEHHHRHVSEIGVHLLLFTRNKGTASHRLEKIAFCYYNMKLKLRDEEAKMNKVAENDYIDLLDIAGQPSDDDNNPIQQWIMTAHLDDEQGNPDAVIAQHATQEGVDVDRVISEDVRS
ncbi:uncharacterized protein [Malus domestica]|uniref:uncharacterized protein n=1 Tax=Malus domestica TaxID=3750 RepID=UPI0010AA952C|nr:uncharacterized protein LOC114826420 [Malus domestica]